MKHFKKVKKVWQWLEAHFPLSYGIKITRGSGD